MLFQAILHYWFQCSSTCAPSFGARAAANATVLSGADVDAAGALVAVGRFSGIEVRIRRCGLTTDIGVARQTNGFNQFRQTSLIERFKLFQAS